MRKQGAMTTKAWMLPFFSVLGVEIFVLIITWIPFFIFGKFDLYTHTDYAKIFFFVVIASAILGLVYDIFLGKILKIFLYSIADGTNTTSRLIFYILNEFMAYGVLGLTLIPLALSMQNHADNSVLSLVLFCLCIITIIFVSPLLPHLKMRVIVSGALIIAVSELTLHFADINGPIISAFNGRVFEFFSLYIFSVFSGLIYEIGNRRWTLWKWNIFSGKNIYEFYIIVFFGYYVLVESFYSATKLCIELF